MNYKLFIIRYDVDGIGYIMFNLFYNELIFVISLGFFWIGVFYLCLILLGSLLVVLK